MAEQVRLDVALVRRGLARSRTEARGLIEAGRVSRAGQPLTKASTSVDDGDRLAVDRPEGPRWVGRAALKLQHALALWEPLSRRVEGARAIDVGASTGGFTQVLLHHGAASVVALDVGHGQLVPEIALDPRVTECSGLNIRDADPAALGAPFDVIVADLSFISLKLVAADLRALGAANSQWMLLIKPQFEVGRERLARSGVVTSPPEHRRVLAETTAALASHGIGCRGLSLSPIRGGEGNTEYLFWGVSESSDRMSEEELIATIARLITEEPA